MPSFPRSIPLPIAFGVALACIAPANVSAQREDDSRARTRRATIFAIGDHPRVDGVRLNFRDRDLELVRGLNLTVWTPYEDARDGTVQGFALGLPATGAGTIHGVGIGAFGVAAREDLRGIAVGGIGLGAGGDVRGLAVGGAGVGAGRSVRGLAVGGVGVGTGGSVRGALIGGVGVGAGGSARGLLVGGVGVGAGDNLRGLAVGGVGVGVGGDLRGLAVGGVGVGGGGEIYGITVAGVGIGAGERLRGLAVAGVGVGAPEIVGGAMALAVGADRVRGAVIAPALFRLEPDGRVTGVSVSTVNAVRGSQHGLAIGVVNYARSLRGVQLGVINIVRDNPRGRRVLPVLNVGAER